MGGILFAHTMADQISNVLDFVKNNAEAPLKITSPKFEPAPDDWVWPVAPEVEKNLRVMGIYDIMREQVYTFETCRNKYYVDLAKAKIDGLAKTVALMKATMSVLEASGSEAANDNRISEIDIVMHRDEDEDEE